MVMKVYSPEFKVDAVALYHSDPDLTLAQRGVLAPDHGVSSSPRSEKRTTRAVAAMIASCSM